MEDTIDITYNGYENPGLKVNKQWKAELTLRDILRHQAGFPQTLSITTIPTIRAVSPSCRVP